MRSQRTGAGGYSGRPSAYEVTAGHGHLHVVGIAYEMGHGSEETAGTHYGKRRSGWRGSLGPFASREKDLVTGVSSLNNMLALVGNFLNN